MAENLQCEVEGGRCAARGLRRGRDKQVAQRHMAQGGLRRDYQDLQQEWFYITESRCTKWAAIPEFRLISWTAKGLD